jgi:hypothetical protein
MPAKSTRSKPGRAGTSARSGKTAAKAVKTSRAGATRRAGGAAKGAGKSAGKAAGKGAAKGATRTARGAAKGAGKAARGAGKAAAKGGSRTTRLSPGISRIDQPSTRTHGFFVRVGYERTDSGTWRPKHRAFFGDASHGGRNKALRAAEEWLRKIKRA